MKQRSPLAATLLSLFIPFYALYWLIVTAKDMKQRGGTPPPLWMLFAPLLFILPFFVIALTTAKSSGTAKSTSPVLPLIGFLFVAVGIVLSFMYYYKFSQTAEHVTSGKVSKMVAFLLFVFVSPAAVYIIQDALNTTSGATASPVPPTAGASPVNPVPPTTPQPPVPPTTPPPTNPVS
jgi:uncharacterized membrane-anchored protein